MKVLLTNNALANRAGTELYIRDVALNLQKIGHEPFVFSTVLGEVAQEIRENAIPVVDDLSSMSIQPDIIHGHHHLETMIALYHFPRVPAIYFCHGFKPWEEAPPLSDRILKYIAIDQATRDRLVIEHGISEDKIAYMFNFADLEKFKSRKPLPVKPKKALFFSNYANSKNITPLVKACNKAGLDLDIVGLGMHNPSTKPETLLKQYDIVFARGRSAIEAMAVGCAVILLDARKTGPMVMKDNFERLRTANFGIRAREERLNEEAIRKEIDRYNAKDAAQVSCKIREVAGLDLAIEKLVLAYTQVIEEFKNTNPQKIENISQEIAKYLCFLSPRVKENEELKAQLVRLQSQSFKSFLFKKLKSLIRKYE